jgi:hypothetical protein
MDRSISTVRAGGVASSISAAHERMRVPESMKWNIQQALPQLTYTDVNFIESGRMPHARRR